MRAVDVAFDGLLACHASLADPWVSSTERSGASKARVGTIESESTVSSDATRAALNAVFGDYLVERSNPLAISMGFYQSDTPIALAPQALRAALPSFGARVVVLVHGMAQTEACWSFPDDGAVNYGSLLRDQLGLTPLYVRYNTGRHVSQNGRDLARLLERLVDSAPVPIEEISLIGHSLGGLVIRSACHYAEALELTWLRRARRAFYLGSPHLGSPFEKAGNVVSVVLGAIDDPVVRLIHALCGLRGPGVTDLRHGSLLDEDWGDASSVTSGTRRPQTVPLRAAMDHYFVAGTLTEDVTHWATLLLGDAVVRLPSAMDPGLRAGLPERHSAIIGGLTHMQLCRSPEVYARIQAWFGEAPREQPAEQEPPNPLDHAATRLELTSAAGRVEEPAESALRDLDQLDGYRALLQDAVDRGVTAIQEVQEAISARPYDLLEQIPGLGTPTQAVRSIHFTGVRTTYDTIRFVNRLVGGALGHGIATWKNRAR